MNYYQYYFYVQAELGSEIVADPETVAQMYDEGKSHEETAAALRPAGNVNTKPGITKSVNTKKTKA